MTEATTNTSAGPGWDDPPWRVVPTGDGAPVLVVDGFEGPLDWLVEQGRAGRIDLARLSVVELVEAFAAALGAVLDGTDKRPATLARWGAWLVLAADLTLLRSRLLLPADAHAASNARAEAEDLRRQVVDRASIAAATVWLERRDQLGRDVWGRGQAEDRAQAAPTGGDVTGLLRACLVALRVPDGAEEVFRVARPLWSVADAAVRIRALLPELRKGGMPLERCLPEAARDASDYALRCRAAVASTFCAGWELTREEAVVMRQDKEGLIFFDQATYSSGCCPVRPPGGD